MIAILPSVTHEVDPQAVTVRVSDDGMYVGSNPGIIISIPRIYLDIPIEYRIDSLFLSIV